MKEGTLRDRNGSPTCSLRYDFVWLGSAGLCAFCLHGAVENDVELYVMLNASAEARRFGIHEGTFGQWERLVDTSRPSPDDFREPKGSARLGAFHYDLATRSVVVLIRHQ